MSDGEINVIPRLVFAFAARHQDEARQDARHLHDGVQQFAAALRLRARTSRLWLLFKSCGNGWLASTASGVSIGKTSS